MGLCISSGAELSFVPCTIRPVVDYLIWCSFAPIALFGQVWKHSYCRKWNVDTQLKHERLSTHV